MPARTTPETLLAERQWIEALARRLVRDPGSADDVAQETWRRALTNPPERVESPRGWLHSLVTSSARDLHRRTSRREARERVAARPEGTPAAHDLVARAEAQRLVLDAVLALDEPSRRVVLLRFFEGETPAEIARRLGEPAVTIRSRLHRALAVLRGRLDREYGGDRAAWALVLTGTRPPAAPVPILETKGALLMTTTKTAIAGALLALLAFLLWSADDVPAAPQPVKQDEPAPAPKPRAKSEPSVPAEAEPATTVAGSAPPPAAEPAGPTRLALRTLPHREPEAPPEMAGKKKLDDKGQVVEIDGTADFGEIQFGEGGMAMTGWSKWKPIPERGTAVLTGRVLDAAGVPIAGAEVLRIDPEAGGAEGDVVSFRHIEKIGASGADGSFEFRDQPARAYRLAANWHNVMNRPRGLLFSGLVPVSPAERGTVASLELRVPVNSRDFGAIVGRVTGVDGAPVRAEVYVGHSVTRSATDGTFRLEGVASGSRMLEVSNYDHRASSTAVTVTAGRDVSCDVKLEPKRAGEHEISGVVSDTKGRAVAGLTMWCGGIEGVSRKCVTSADGSFRFGKLPAAPEGEGYTVCVMPDFDKPDVPMASVSDIDAPSSDVRIVVERTSMLRIVVRDAATGALLPLFNVNLERRRTVDGIEQSVPFHSAALYEEDGTWEVPVPRTEIILFVEAPDHVPVHAAVDVPDSDGPFEVIVEMQR